MDWVIIFGFVFIAILVFIFGSGVVNDRLYSAYEIYDINSDYVDTCKMITGKYSKPIARDCLKFDMIDLTNKSYINVTVNNKNIN